MKFRAHDTFFIRKGWISKGLRNVDSDPDVFISRERNPMDVLGIGSNMVKALRYWLQATGLTVEPKVGKRSQMFTPFGRCIFENDKYTEELGTLYLLHYRLVSNDDWATAWYYLFNEFSMSEFSREDFVDGIQKFIRINSFRAEVASRSLSDDFNCIINTYMPRNKLNARKFSPENNIDCPLGELGLIDVMNKSRQTYKKVTPSIATLNPWIVLSVIVDNAGGRREISLNELLTAPRNIGRVFNLDSIAMLDALYRLERLGQLKVNRTSGLDVIDIRTDKNFLDCVSEYYAAINGGIMKQ
ncbi:MAG: DUF4007 family protein [Selenomonadaceae bacterium]|nr:DUF4007 family protein [Selenomonadaceae bacterium]